MASDPLLLRLLIGCGLTEFSMTPGALLMARRVVSETSAGEMARIAARVMTLGTVDEIEGVLGEHFGREGAPVSPKPAGGEGGRQEVGTQR
jgi:phosphoenolpyruvate-protein kinase (PTS system EI component)